MSARRSGFPGRWHERIAVGAALAQLAPALAARAANPREVDLLEIPTHSGQLLRVYGGNGSGTSGVPVAGGFDTDGDGAQDVALASMRASPLGRPGAGMVHLVFGDRTLSGDFDTAQPSQRILAIAGDVTSEACGSEIWMDDVTGDGLGDLLVARQNYTPDAARIGAGALSIVVGGAALRGLAKQLQPLDLRSPPASPAVATLVGALQLDRLGIWVRTGDVTGDGIADILVGADQVSELGETHRGAVYLVRGGPHLAATQTIDLAQFGGSALPGNLARLTPPLGSAHHHFGATLQLADLDGNGRAEALVGATLNRAGAALLPAGAAPGSAHSTGGAVDGTLYIAWDDNFPALWPNGFAFEITSGSGASTRINGAACNVSFGEEILGGLDYDGDGAQELFVGDIVGNCFGSRIAAGSGHVFFTASQLRDLDFDLDSPPPGLRRSDIYGAVANDIASDTALHADYNVDGYDDLAIASPHHTPLGRIEAGAIHVLLGRAGGWPAAVDLANLPPASALAVTAIFGARGGAADGGDMIGYSAATGDPNGDGRPDLIVNEMLGNGLAPGATDVGNLIALGGQAVLAVVPAPAFPAPALGAAALALACLAVRRLRASR
jgi:hypothetical protein